MYRAPLSFYSANHRWILVPRSPKITHLLAAVVQREHATADSRRRLSIIATAARGLLKNTLGLRIPAPARRFAFQFLPHPRVPAVPDSSPFGRWPRDGCIIGVVSDSFIEGAIDLRFVYPKLAEIAQALAGPEVIDG